MSYILDALRKADADRERDAASDLLGAPAVDDSAAPPPAPGPRVPVWRWLAAGAAVPLVALLAWRWATPDEPPPVVAAVTAAAAPATVAPPAAPPAPAAMSAPASAAMGLAGAASAVDPAEDAAPAASEAPVPAPARPAAPKPAARKVPPKAAVAAATTSSARAEARQRAASAPVRAFAELPADLRSQVPAMTIGGSVYSSSPDSRMLIVNGQVMREGATLAPGLQLESIGRQSAVFSIRGQRFEMKL